jgi:alcohol dehydrogenase/L-iditol 2-dehydrogenase
MIALVKYGTRPGEVELREAPLPEIGPNDVLLRTAACGVCGSDLEMYHHQATYVIDVPVTLGHEFSGTVVEVGDAVRDWQPGDRVVSETAAHICGRCAMCRGGQYNLCPERRGFGSRVNGAFATYVGVPERILHRVPDGLDLETAALTEPLSVAYNALVVKSRIRPGDTVVVFGAGPIGLLAMQVALVCGARQVIVAGLSSDKERLAVAGRLGAEAVNVEESDLPALLGERTAGLGADLVVDAAGPNPVMVQAMEIVRPNGQITKIGWDPRPANYSLDPLLIKAVTLQGVFSHTWTTWEKALALLASNQIQSEPMISHRLPLSSWRAAFELVEKRQAIKTLILPSAN